MTVAVPMLETVTDCAAEVILRFWPLNVRVLVLRLMVLLFTCPEPVRLTVCGLVVASLVTVNVPVRVPVDVGVKVIETEQVAPEARVAPQVFALIP